MSHPILQADGTHHDQFKLAESPSNCAQLSAKHHGVCDDAHSFPISIDIMGEFDTQR